jgi:NADH-quinone oxidoreductase subunit E
VSVCTNVSCLVNGGPELLEALRSRYVDGDVLVEEVECLAACDLAPVIQVNYEFHGPVTTETAIDVIERYRSGELAARTVSGTSPLVGTASGASSGADRPGRSTPGRGA